MLSTPEILIYGFLAFILLPIVVVSLLTGSKAPESFLSKYYRAEPYLNFSGNLFVLTICASSLAKLALHFGFIAPPFSDSVEFVIGVLTTILFFVFVGLWIKSYLKVRRQKEPV